MNSKTKTSSVTTTKKTDNTKVQKITRKKVRLFFYGGAKSDADNNTFLSAAKTVKYDYEKDNEGNIKIKEIYEMEDAEDIIEKIDSEEDNSIESIDFFSHGGEVALYVKHMSFLGKDFNQSLYMSAEVERQFETFFGYSSNLSEINYNKFSNTAIIEIHGCKTASMDKKYNNINFAMTLSKYLYDAGKVKSFVIGHVTNANPNQHKTLQGNDYRHGGRRIYHNGLEFLFTRDEGRITSKKLNDMLNN